MDSGFRHETAIVESDRLGSGVRVYAYAHVMPGASIGDRTTLGDHVFVEGGAVIGANVTIKNGVLVWDGVTIQDDVFVGPGVVFTNDLRPRSPRSAVAANRYAEQQTWLTETTIATGASLGANATILPGAHVGAYAMVGAGSVVVRPVPAFALVVGSPAQVIGHVCRCGERLRGTYCEATCAACGETPEQRTAALVSCGDRPAVRA
ncbi:MAG: N-acetyltransferase [Planctomycetales bacterium]|nr:N-acetyltransferase [Planctomycetales bacterium]